jgi:hypothetical protein
MKKTLSLEEIEGQTALELPARELMTVNTFTNFASSRASNNSSSSAGNGSLLAILNIAATVLCVQSADANSDAFQNVQ